MRLFGRWTGGAGGTNGTRGSRDTSRATAAAILALAALLVQTPGSARAANPTQRAAQPATQPAVQVEETTTRGGATQRLLLVLPAAPRAVVIIVPREHRYLTITPDGTVQGEAAAGFLVRSRLLLAARGLAVALPTATAYPRNTAYVDDEVRVHGNPVADMAALATRLRQRLKIPVWLLAEHDSAEFAAGAVVTVGRSRDFDGLVIAGGLLNGKGGLANAEASKIGIPTLLVQHKDDACAGAGFGEAQALFDALEQAPRKDLLGVSGGRDRDSRRAGQPGAGCSPFARHGFNGIETLVVGGIADWLENAP